MLVAAYRAGWSVKSSERMRSSALPCISGPALRSSHKLSTSFACGVLAKYMMPPDVSNEYGSNEMPLSPVTCSSFVRGSMFQPRAMTSTPFMSKMLG